MNQPLNTRVRSTKQAAWRDLDGLLAGHRRFSAYTRGEAISVVRHSFYRGNFRFEIFSTPDPSRSDWFRYEVRLRQHLYANHHGE